MLPQITDKNGDKVTTAMEPNCGNLQHQAWQWKGRNAKKEDVNGRKERWEPLKKIIQGVSENFTCPDMMEGDPTCKLPYWDQAAFWSRRNLN